MKNNEFRTPLMQSGALLVAIVFIISLLPSGDSMSIGTAIGSFIGGIFKAFLYVIALALGIAISIAVLIAIFLGSVALQSPEKAAEIYTETKKRFAILVQNMVGNQSSSADTAAIGISQEEYDQMKTELSSLQNKNLKLQGNLSSLESKNAQLQDDIHGLNQMVNELKESEKSINELLTTMSAKLEEEPDTELKEQVQKLEQMCTATTENLADLSSRLEFLEEAATGPEVAEVQAGIFQYIESEEDQGLFTKKVEEGVAKDLTYAQFDEFFTEELSAELDQIIKDHPSLTKDFIRTKRK